MATPTPIRLNTFLRAIHKRGQSLNLLKGLMALSKWAIVIFLGILIIDWWLHIPKALRFVTLGILIAVSVRKAWAFGWRYLKSISLANCALRAEEHYKDLESLLVTGVQLSTQTATGGTSEAMSVLTVEKAEEAVNPLRPSAVVPLEELKRPAAFTVVLVLAIVILGAFNPGLMGAGLTRVFMPWTDEVYPTRTKMKIDEGEIVVKEGDSVTIHAELSDEIPKTAKLAIRTGKGKPRKRKLDVVDGICEYRIAAAFRSFEYRIHAGDADSGWRKVTVITAPRPIRTRIRLVYPSYMDREPDVLEAMTLTVPEGSTIEWDLTLDRAVSSAAFRIDNGEADPLQVSEDGLRVRHKIGADASGTYSFEWVEKAHGFDFKTAKHYLQVAPDQAPQIEMTSPQRNLFATIGRRMDLQYRARDDHGLGECKIVYSRGNAEAKYIPFTAAVTKGRKPTVIDWDYRKPMRAHSAAAFTAKTKSDEEANGILTVLSLDEERTIKDTFTAECKTVDSTGATFAVTSTKSGEGTGKVGSAAGSTAVIQIKRKEGNTVRVRIMQGTVPFKVGDKYVFRTFFDPQSTHGLEVGESISFAIQVTDRYPSEKGPHRVRSETRRMSFLSKEDYLAKIHEQKDRLLSQLRAVYRQERSAHEVIRALDPDDEAFEQICFLESARQDILVERIAILNEAIAELIHDLKANNIKDEAEYAGLNELRESLAEISKNNITAAAAKLRDLGPMTNPGMADVVDAARTINDAARQLSSLVLRLGVKEALEVFAMELHVVAQAQSSLRVKTLEADGTKSALSARQKELAGWVDRLLSELSADPDYSKAPLAVVRLARMVKDLRKAGMDKAMLKAAATIQAGELKSAAEMQDKIIADLFALECNVRVGSEYEALLNARQLFTSGINQLTMTSRVDSRVKPEEAAQQLGMLRKKIRLLILPVIPAPEPELLDEKATEIPPVDQFLPSVRKSLRDAAASLNAGRRDESLTHQKTSLETLKTLNGIIKSRLDEVMKVARYGGNSGLSLERSTMVRELLASQMRLSEKAEDLEYEMQSSGKAKDAENKKQSAAYLAPSQLQLSKEVLRMRDRLERKSRRVGASKEIAPMLRMLEGASVAMTKAAPALKANKIEDALNHQMDAEDALKAAMGFANHDANVWVGLANLLIVAEGTAMPARFMGYIVDEQKDLIGETGKSTPKSRKDLVKIQKNLAQAVLEVSMLLDGTGSALDFEQAMLFAGSDMGKSVLQLEASNIKGAQQAQGQAVESVAELHKQFATFEKQFHYFVKVMEFLQKAHGKGVVAADELSRFARLLKGVERVEKQQIDELVRIAVAVDAFATGMFKATGTEAYAESKSQLAGAVKKLESGDRDGCMADLAAVDSALKESMSDMRELLSKVAYVPSVDPIEAPPEYGVMLEMVSLVLEQTTMERAIHDTAAGKLSALASELRELEATATDLIASTNKHKKMITAKALMKEAADFLAKSARKEAYIKLRDSRTAIRHCILEYVLFYIEIKRPRGSRRKKKGKSGIVTMFKMSTKMKQAYDKDWGGVDGEDPESGRTEWEVLGRRDRAALNENFVRELPLEYREFLKDYYERLTR